MKNKQVVRAMKNGTCVSCERMLSNHADIDGAAITNDDLVLSPSQAPVQDISEAASEVTSLRASTLFANNQGGGSSNRDGFRQIIQLTTLEA